MKNLKISIVIFIILFFTKGVYAQNTYTYTLYDADANQVAVQSFNSNLSWDLDIADGVNLVSDVGDGIYYKVKFNLTDNAGFEHNKTESFFPYSAYGDNGGNHGLQNGTYIGWHPAEGTIYFTVRYFLNATGFDNDIEDVTDTFSITFFRSSTTTDTQPPTTPTLSSTGQTGTTVDLSWSGATDNVGITGYKVYRGSTLQATLGNVTSHTVTGLTASTTYSFTIRALDAAGNESANSNSISVTTNSAADTQPPTTPTLTSSGKTETSVDLSWTGTTDNVGVTGYQVYIGNNLTTTLGNVSSYQVTGLTEDTTYQFTVKAIDAAGNESANSNTISVTTDAASSSGGGSSGGGSNTTTSVWTEANATASYSGDVAIGTASVPSGYKLAVEGKIRTREVRVDQDTWPDYVFKEDYNLPNLKEIQKHIQEKGHLPNIPSAKEVEANGVELGEMNRLLLEKIEELMLYTIQQQEEIEKLKTKINNQ